MTTDYDATSSALNTRAEELISGAAPVYLANRNAEERSFYEIISARFGAAAATFFMLHEKRRVVLEIDEDAVPAPANSYIGGHPFVAADEDFSWPVAGDSGRPMTFLMQVNFAEVPRLEGFPENGLLQWWVQGADDTYGLTFEDDATGREGLITKFYPESVLSAAASSPTDPIPNSPDEDELGPLWGTAPLGIRGFETLSFPYYEESTVSTAVYNLFSDFRSEFDYDREDDDLRTYLSPRTQLGGYAGFVQGDPRSRGGRPETLVLQLESEEATDGRGAMWGDMGNAQLFGDLKSLRSGDTSTLWWDWACG